jgi:D-amino peptidase
MKLYLSADIEGVTGVTHWDEATPGKPGYNDACRQMTEEVRAACEGAIDAGAEEIVVQDAHEFGRNIDMNRMPEAAKIIRGWSDHPLCMLQGLDESFSAVALVGHHTASGSSGSPLFHTISTQTASLKINGRLASEYLIMQYSAAFLGVPVVFLSGDRAVCEEAKTVNPIIRTTAVKEGTGNSMIHLHPVLAARRIREGVLDALSADLSSYAIALPERFDVEIAYRHHGRAFKMGFYPGARRVDDFTVAFGSDDWFEVLRMLAFTAFN